MNTQSKRQKIRKPVLKALLQKKWLSTSDIEKKIGINTRNSVYATLWDLHKEGVVEKAPKKINGKAAWRLVSSDKSVNVVKSKPTASLNDSSIAEMEAALEIVTEQFALIKQQYQSMVKAKQALNELSI